MITQHNEKYLSDKDKCLLMANPDYLHHKEQTAAYRKSAQGVKVRREYDKNFIKEIVFLDVVDEGIYLNETIRYNSNTGSVYVFVTMKHPRRPIIFIDI